MKWAQPGLKGLMFAIVMAEVTAGFETTMVLTALSKMIGHYGDAVSVGWLVTGYLLVATASSGIAASLGDRFGRRKVLLIILALASAGSIISVSSDSLQWLIAGRCLQGVAGAILPLCFGLAKHHLPPELIGRGLGIIAATASLSSAAGFLVGGMVVDFLGWHHVFTVSAASALIAVILCAALIPADSIAPSSKGVDFVGALLFAPAIAALLLAISELSRGFAILSGSSLLFLAGLAMLGCWVWHELRTEHPLIDLRLLTIRPILTANLCLFFVGLSALQPQFILLLLQQPTWTGIGLGASAAIASVVKSPAQIIGGMSSYGAGRAAAQVGAPRLMIAATGLMLAGLVSIATFHDALVAIIAAYIVIGIGIGLLMTAAPLMILSAAPPERASEATGLASVSRFLGTAIGAQIIAILLASSYAINPDGTYSNFPHPDAYRLCFIYLITLSSAALLIAMISNRSLRRHVQEAVV